MPYKLSILELVHRLLCRLGFHGFNEEEFHNLRTPGFAIWYKSITCKYCGCEFVNHIGPISD